jgi:hypothetical protein
LRFVANRDLIYRAPVVDGVWSLEVPIFESQLLARTLIYTALIRGMQQVVFIGDRSAFEVAAAAPPHSHERQVGFSM